MRDRRRSRRRVHERFRLHNNRSANRSGVEKCLCHFLRYSNATMRGSIWRNVALVHCVTASEKHSVGHARAIVMRALGSGIFSRIDVRLHDVARVVHVIAEDSGDVRRVFGQDRVMAGRSAETGFAGRDGCFAYKILTLEKIGALLGNADDDFGLTGNAIAIPIAGRRKLRRRRGRCRRRIFGAAG